MKQTIGIVATTLLVIAFVFFAFFPSGRAMLNNYGHTMQKVDDATLYKTRKTVEDTARASIASYTTDKLTYGQYKDSQDKEKQSWAEQAKMRANKTAAIYNEYFTKNSYVWKDNIPSDIWLKLEYIE